MLRLAIAFLLAGATVCGAQQLTLTPAGSLPLDAYGYTQYPVPSVGGVGNTGSCPLKNLKDASGKFLTCYVKVSDSVGSDTNCLSYPTYSDNDAINIPCKTISRAIGLLPTRVAAPDWILLRKGDTFKDQFINMSISGISQTSPYVVTAYPLNATGAFPVIESPAGQSGFTSGGGSGTPFGDYFMLTGLSFYAYTHDPACTNPCVFNSALTEGAIIVLPVHWALIENNVFNFYSAVDINIDANDFGVAQTVVFRRNIVTNNWGGPGQHPPCVFVAQVQNFIMQDNVCDHNGWNTSVYNADMTQFNQGLYLDGANGPANVTGNFFVNGSADAVQARIGGFISDNLTATNPFGPLVGNTPSTVSYNVVTESTNINFSPLQTTATGTATLTFGLPLPTQLSPGLSVYDSDNPTFIPASTILSFNLGAGTVTITPAASSTIPIGDHIIFYSPRGAGITTSAFVVPTATTNAPSPVSASTFTGSFGATITTGTASALPITSGTYNNTTGAVSLTMSASPNLVVGKAFQLAGITDTGLTTLNGVKVTVTGTSGATVNFTAATGLCPGGGGCLSITTGSISTVTVSGTVGLISIVDIITGTGAPANCTISAQVSGTTGGDGVYVPSATTTLSGASLIDTSTILNVTAVSIGSLAVGQIPVAATVVGVPDITAQLTGPAGGIGTYSTFGAARQFTASTTMSGGTNLLHFASGVPVGNILGGPTAVTDSTNPSAIPFGTLATANSSTTTAALGKTITATVNSGDIIQFPPIGPNNSPYFGPVNPTNLINNIVLGVATVPTSPTPVTGLFAYNLGANTSGAVNSGNVGCGNGFTAANLYQDLGVPGTNTPQLSAGTFQANTCAGIGPDPGNATLEAYALSLGLSPTLAALTACFELMSKDNFVNGTFNPACMAHQANNNLRGKLGVHQN